MHYLGDEWIAAANDAVSAAAATAPPDRLVIDQHIDGERSYRVVVAQGDCSVTSPIADETAADASFTQSRQTAIAVATGETDAHQAFLLGTIRFEGDIDVLIERRDAFGWLQTALAPVMAATQYDD